MSSARPNPFDRHAELGAAIVNELHAKALPVTPRDFGVWFAYRSGSAPGLNAAVDAIRAERELRPSDIARLHEQHLSPWRMSEPPETIAADLADELHDLAVTL